MIKSRCLKNFLIYVLMDIFFKPRSKLVRIHVKFWPYCVSLGSNDSCHVLFELSFCQNCKEKKRNCSNVNNEQMLNRKSNFKLKLIQINSSPVELFGLSRVLFKVKPIIPVRKHSTFSFCYLQKKYSSLKFRYYKKTTKI